MFARAVTAKGVPVEKQTVIIFDHTAEASLTLWNKECISATPWKPSSTVLLITSPVFRPTPKVAKDDVSCTNNPPVTGGTTNSNDKSPHKSQQQTPLWRTTRLPELRINANTLVDIDPDIRDAAWLRTYMTRLTRRASVNPAFPTGIFDVESALTAPNRILFRLADLDEWVRAAPTAAAPARDQTFVGFLSVVVLEVHLARLHQRGMLCSGECCGVPLYANAMTARCRRQCGREEEQEEVVLRLNPKILGTVMDETGSVGSGKMVLSEEAWGQLLGRGKEGIVGMGVRELKEVEATMLFLRVTLVVGVLGDGGNGDGEDDEGEGEEEEEEEEKENGEKECSVESGDLINMGSRKRHGWGNEARREGDDEGGMSRIVVLAVLN
ncbi:hypothetical protein MMC25_002417 [Agyrium rufum]|nr:hypothetical protein [Agyrium rufum]